MKRLSRLAVLFAAFFAVFAFAEDLERYALILNDPPVAAQAPSRKELRAQGASDASARLAAVQQTLREQLAERGIAVTGAAHTLVNAVFVRAPEEREAELRGLPGVKRVQQLRPIRLQLNRAADLVNAQAAWNRVGGAQNAGAGVKIGILDSGIDQEHPAFQDGSLAVPPGFPKGPDEYRAFTNNKIIVARSYVRQLAAGSSSNPAADSRPDDLSPRDRAGHGTAVAMIAAGRSHRAPAATISGVAPKAWLGNYKVFGSPGVNDSTFADVYIAALEDALNDGMDIVTLSLGLTSTYGPLDTGSICGEAASVPCDVDAQAVENAVKAGLAVIVPAGNTGDFGIRLPTLTTIETPGTAPSAITVGVTTNAHVWFSRVQVTGSDAPRELQNIRARLGDGPKPPGPARAPVKDVAQLEDDGRACSPLASGSLGNSFALIQRGNCSFTQKVINAERAGAAGVILYQAEGLEGIFQPSGLAGTAIPTVMIPNSTGKQLKSFVGSRPDREAVIDPSLAAVDAPADEVAEFSSQGPSIGEIGIKPELVAPGTDLYTATQRFDPNSDMFDATGYTVVDGSSFAVPMVAGAGALVKQQKRDLRPGQLKSLLVNTANPQVQDAAGRARVTAAGAGKLDAAAALESSVALEPAAVSFGIPAAASLPISRTLQLTNVGSARVQLNLSVAQRDQDARGQVSVSPNSVALNPGQSQQVAVRLGGTLPNPGAYEGAITVQGGGPTLRVPYLYMVGDNNPQNAFPLLGFDFAGVINERIPGRLIALKVVDRYGVPVQRLAVRFRASIGGGFIDAADERTDNYGIAAARVFLGPQLGDQQFTAEAGGLTVEFNGRARIRPAIETDGVLNAASLQRGAPVASGSYMSIFGRGLADVTKAFSTPYLPLSLTGVSVSFDVPGRGISVPGRLHFVSESQINVQVPWELQGTNTAQIKVSIGNISSAVYNLALNDYAPAFFEYPDPSGRNFIAALDEGFRLIGSANAARRGRSIQLYANGLGPVDNQPFSGEVSPAQPLAATRVTPEVTIGGRPAQVQFSGLAPNIVGLYQINVVVPADAPTGVQPVVVTVNGVAAKAASIPVQ